VEGKLYYGIKTGLNEAFVIDRATRDRLIAEHPSSSELLKPFLRGRDVKRWYTSPQDLWLVFTRHGTDIDKYPAIKKHLSQNKKQLTPGIEGGRKPGIYKWYEIQWIILPIGKNSRKPKIVWGNLAKKPQFSFAKEGIYVNAPANIIVSNSNYLLGILNSKITQYLVSQSAAQRQGGFLEFKPMYIAPLAIPDQPKDEIISHLVDQILGITENSDYPENPAKQAKVKEIEKQIDQLVYQLYGLTPEEIALLQR
jgi:adenine-specific DNA-methyltransferase